MNDADSEMLVADINDLDGSVDAGRPVHRVDFFLGDVDGFVRRRGLGRSYSAPEDGKRERRRDRPNSHVRFLVLPSSRGARCLETSQLCRQKMEVQFKAGMAQVAPRMNAGGAAG